MAKYGAKVGKGAASITIGVASIEAPATGMRRAKIYDLMFGSDATPADNALTWELQRCTGTTATGTAVTPNAMDPADALAVTVVKSALTANNSVLTAGAIPISISLNQRATFRWVAAPGGELMIPAVATNGFQIMTPTAGGTPSVNATVHFEEQ